MRVQVVGNWVRNFVGFPWLYGCGSTRMGSHCGIGAPPGLEPCFFCGDVHWGHDLAFDPWPNHELLISVIMISIIEYRCVLICFFQN